MIWPLGGRGLAVLVFLLFVLLVLTRVSADATPAAPLPSDVQMGAGAPDFTLGVIPERVEATAGDTVHHTVTVTPVEGFHAPITLSTPRLPKDITSRFSANPVVPPASVTLVLDTAATLSAGTYTITVSAEGDGILHSVRSLLVLREQHLYLRIVRFLLTGVGVTLQITFFGIVLAVVLGLLIGIARTSRNPIVYSASTLYVEVIRGIPLLVQIFFIYFGVGQLLVEVFHTQGIDPVQAGILGMGLGYAAYMGETYRAGIQSIHRGQMEAARSLGMSYLQAMRYVILPQAIRRILPPLGNDCVAMLKDSSLASAIGVEELSRRGREFTMSTFKAFETWTMVALLYLIMTVLFSQIARSIERRMAAGE